MRGRAGQLVSNPFNKWGRSRQIRAPRDRSGVKITIPTLCPRTEWLPPSLLFDTYEYDCALGERNKEKATLVLLAPHLTSFTFTHFIVPSAQNTTHSPSSLTTTMSMTTSLSISRFLSSAAAATTTTRASFFPPKSLSFKTSFHRNLSKPLTLPFSTRTTNRPIVTASISVGEKLPDATLSYFDAAGELQTTTISSLTANKKAILFAVPGAFTPTCSQKHLPGFVDKAADLKSKGVDTIACISVNDAFVMKAWKENLGVNDEVLLLSDGNGEFTRAIGCELDLSDKPIGLGVRSRRYALLAEDGVVKVLNLEEGGAFTFSSAEDMLKVL